MSRRRLRRKTHASPLLADEADHAAPLISAARAATNTPKTEVAGLSFCRRTSPGSRRRPLTAHHALLSGFICILSLVQASVVALPAAHTLAPLRRLRSGWWRLVPVGSVVAFVFGVRALGGVADG